MRRLAVLLALALLVPLAACGDDEGGDTGEAAGTGTIPPGVTETAASSEAPATTEAEPSTAEPEPTTADGTTETVDPADSTGEDSGEGTDTAPAEGTPVAVYLVRNEKVSPVRRLVDGEAPARAALEALVAGPTATDGDRTSEIPEGTELLDVAIDDAGLLTVDLSDAFDDGGGSLSMQMRVAQVVHTAFQFPTVTGVAFRMNGEPVTALGGEGVVLEAPQTPADWEDLTPAIVVTSPLPGDTVSCPIRATGTSNVFEASSLMGVVASEETPPPHDDPTIVTATSGTGTRGTFDVEVPCTPPDGGGTLYLVSWWDSAKDGSAQGVEYIPVEFE